MTKENDHSVMWRCGNIAVDVRGPLKTGISIARQHYRKHRKNTACAYVARTPIATHVNSDEQNAQHLDDLRTNRIDNLRLVLRRMSFHL